MNIPIQREFIKWYFDEPFPGPGSKRNRNRFLEEFFDANSNFNNDTMRYWLEQAFHQGAKAQMNLIREDWYKNNSDAIQ